MALAACTSITLMTVRVCVCVCVCVCARECECSQFQGLHQTDLILLVLRVQCPPFCIIISVTATSHTVALDLAE